MTTQQRFEDMQDKYIAKFGNWPMQDDDSMLPLEAMINLAVYCLDHDKPYEDLTDEEYEKARAGQ